MTLYEEIIKIKELQLNDGKLDPANKYHLAMMAKYGINEDFEFYDEEWGWQTLCLMPTAVMLGDIPAQLIKFNKNKFPVRKRKLRNKKVRFIRYWKDVERRIQYGISDANPVTLLSTGSKKMKKLLEKYNGYYKVRPEEKWDKKLPRKRKKERKKEVKWLYEI